MKYFAQQDNYSDAYEKREKERSRKQKIKEERSRKSKQKFTSFASDVFI